MHRLAGHLGKTVEEISQMSSSEYAHWVAFSSKYPLNDDLICLNFGWLLTKIGQMLGSKDTDIVGNTLKFKGFEKEAVKTVESAVTQGQIDADKCRKWVAFAQSALKAKANKKG